MTKLIFGFLLLFPCLVSVGQRETPRQYIERYKALAISEMKRSGVPASITLAQGILESESGNSDLVKRSNNHFGIKCKSDWAGPSVSHDDDAPGECFRAYEHAEGSYRDHSDFLRNSARYASLFDLEPQDYKGWATGLKKAGYATNPKYAQILIDNIEKYDLNQYTIDGLLQGVDMQEYREATEVAMQPEHIAPVNEQPTGSLRATKINKLRAVEATAGTSLLAIATRFNVKLSRLLEWNELESDGILNKSQIIYLEKKHTSGLRESVVFPQDKTLYEIAQSQGVTTTDLAVYNGMKKYEIVKAGTVVYLKADARRKDIPVTMGTGNIHTVESKEGLFAISRKYGVTVEQLKQWNQLADDNLQIGQKLIVSK